MPCTIAWLTKKQRVRMRATGYKSNRDRRARFFSEEDARRKVMFALLILCSAATVLTPVRALWTHERSSMWWENIVGRNFIEEDWLSNFRMSKKTFNFLCNELRH